MTVTFWRVGFWDADRKFSVTELAWHASIVVSLCRRVMFVGYARCHPKQVPQATWCVLCFVTYLSLCCCTVLCVQAYSSTCSRTTELITSSLTSTTIGSPTVSMKSSPRTRSLSTHRVRFVNVKYFSFNFSHWLLLVLWCCWLEYREWHLTCKNCISFQRFSGHDPNSIIYGGPQVPTRFWNFA